MIYVPLKIDYYWLNQNWSNTRKKNNWFPSKWNVKFNYIQKYSVQLDSNKDLIRKCIFTDIWVMIIHHLSGI